MTYGKKGDKCCLQKSDNSVTCYRPSSPFDRPDVSTTLKMMKWNLYLISLVYGQSLW